MAKIFLFILSISFVLQTGASFYFVEKKAVDTEQCPDEKNGTDENSKALEKKDQDQVSVLPETCFRILFHDPSIAEIALHVLPGHLHKILLPPR